MESIKKARPFCNCVAELQQGHGSANAAIQWDVSPRYAVIRCTVDYFSEMNDLIGECELQSLMCSLWAIVEQDCQDGEQILRSRMEGLDAQIFFTDMGGVDRRVERWEYQFQSIAKRKNVPYLLSLSVGVYVTDKQEKSPVDRQCYRKAAFAHRFGKIASNPSVRYYREEDYQKRLHRRCLEIQMHTALNEHRFLVYLQPQYNLYDCSIVGAEALVRWDNPQLGMIMPNEFIPLFEQNGFILRLDFYMLEEVCKLISKWHQQNLPIVPVSLNFSRLHASTENFLSRLLAVTEKYQVKPEELRIEWTESAYSEKETQIIQIARQLRSKGFHVAMDDFGSGYSSLNALTELPVDFIKLDKRILNFERPNIRHQLILENMMRMVKDLHYTVIAEGVEYGWQAELLQKLHCDFAQGFFFSLPVSVPNYEKMMRP